jgi:hypothetical protein
MNVNNLNDMAGADNPSFVVKIIGFFINIVKWIYNLLSTLLKSKIIAILCIIVFFVLLFMTICGIIGGLLIKLMLICLGILTVYCVYRSFF